LDTPPLDTLPLAPATERNKEPILDVLRCVLPQPALVLEVASGLGQHGAHFARFLPHLVWQPSETDAESLGVLRARVAQTALPNLLTPLTLDVQSERWPIERADAVFNANMIHISPWAATRGLFVGSARLLAPGALLITYGPYLVPGQATAQSNLDFDAWLRAKNPDYGLRDLGEVSALASEAGFELKESIAMPANNLSVVWRRVAPDAVR
jgi:hypothetical protein